MKKRTAVMNNLLLFKTTKYSNVLTNSCIAYSIKPPIWWYNRIWSNCRGHFKILFKFYLIYTFIYKYRLSLPIVWSILNIYLTKVSLSKQINQKIDLLSTYYDSCKSDPENSVSFNILGKFNVYWKIFNFFEFSRLK